MPRAWWKGTEQDGGCRTVNGLEVLRRCAAYTHDMEKLKSQKALALDAAVRITPGMDTSGGGRSSDISAKPERFVQAADWLERRMSARRCMYALELEEAARLLEHMEPANADALRLVMITGLTVRQAAGEMRRSCDAVRGLLSRSRSILKDTPSRLSDDPDYQDLLRQYSRRFRDG